MPKADTSWSSIKLKQRDVDEFSLFDWKRRQIEIGILEVTVLKIRRRDILGSSFNLINDLIILFVYNYLAFKESMKLLILIYFNLFRTILRCKLYTLKSRLLCDTHFMNYTDHNPRDAL